MKSFISSWLSTHNTTSVILQCLVPNFKVIIDRLVGWFSLVADSTNYQLIPYQSQMKFLVVYFSGTKSFSDHMNSFYTGMIFEICTFRITKPLVCYFSIFYSIMINKNNKQKAKNHYFFTSPTAKTLQYPAMATQSFSLDNVAILHEPHA
jgi:hypothetical protein